MNRLYSCSRHFLNKTRLLSTSNTSRYFSSKHNVEPKAESPEPKSSDKVVLDDSTVTLLERLSLVNFGSEKSKAILEDAIKFADKIHNVNVDNVKPLINVLDKEWSTPCRDDVVQMENSTQDVKMNTKHVEEDYFVAPPSNVPLHQETNKKK
ncbi:glutamyl-tRNA(Gln) amidotransferase subunit C, mitochondrial [Diaphorina citri]|uniref:Glutamyl-tRNA(Gln) amidotransferase subunit C, mitochondrial n=1 Tax=Diaphorina citri TaxID=121845 RepID=A0A1S3D9Y5_DIACI|nr:glutamyl-tRNA(Gln) amidotransferase subunit C, mitochondrial [Diaphorina citri]KAI5698188.1 hypothetical protein M8J75_003097 [Diaphorina citri]KAI5728777.1 hypothetical protein M8J77_021005 [Diaphorina citri]